MGELNEPKHMMGKTVEKLNKYFKSYERPAVCVTGKLLPYKLPKRIEAERELVRAMQYRDIERAQELAGMLGYGLDIKEDGSVFADMQE